MHIPPHPKKILWFGIYDRMYSRNDVLMTGLRENGIIVEECQADWKDPKRYVKLLRALREKIRAEKSERSRAADAPIDVIYAAYPAPVPAILAKIFTRKPVVLDAFYSMYDAVVNDRREISRFHPRALKLLFIDWLALMLADVVIVDTEQDKIYWSKWLFAEPSKIRVVYLGAKAQAGASKTPSASGADGTQKFIVHWNGKYIPLQGVEQIVEAARILSEDPSISIRLLGWNKRTKADALIEKYSLKNVERIGRVPLEEYHRYMAEADIVLGIFGTTAKAKRVIPNKVYEALAIGKPAITMDTPALREAFTGEEVCLVNNDPKSIAEAVLKLKADPALRRRLGESGYAKILARFEPKRVGADLLSALVS